MQHRAHSVADLAKSSILMLIALHMLLPANTLAEVQQSSPAYEVAAAVELLAADGDLWPGYDPLAVPLAIFDGTDTYLFRHPAPPESFELVARSNPAAQRLTGRLPSLVANTSIDLGGVRTAIVMLDPDDEPSPTSLAAVAIHEAFHAFQRVNHPDWTDNVGDLFTYPVTDAGWLTLRREETAYLRRALRSADPDDRAAWALMALIVRQQRYEGMEPAYVAYERGAELNEGLAAYIQYRALDDIQCPLPPAGFAATDVRLRAYVTGRALALLLDQFARDWKASFEQDDTQSLDLALAAVLQQRSHVTGYTLSDSEREDSARQAEADVLAVVENRRDLHRSFHEREGWRIVIVTEVEQPLWPQGFDPMNVTMLEGSVLHTRFLKLGNSGCELEILGGEALTEQAGDHPLYNGIRRVVVTGLEAEPQVNRTDDRVQLEAPALTAEFVGAVIERSDRCLTVRLGG
ncbi:MAG: hypothetical protein GY838_04280 [bacterium]|nr:hypothetical protein [bacterium]